MLSVFRLMFIYTTVTFQNLPPLPSRPKMRFLTMRSINSESTKIKPASTPNP